MLESLVCLLSVRFIFEVVSALFFLFRKRHIFLMFIFFPLQLFQVLLCTHYVGYVLDSVFGWNASALVFRMKSSSKVNGGANIVEGRNEKRF